MTTIGLKNMTNKIAEIQAIRMNSISEWEIIEDRSRELEKQIKFYPVQVTQRK